MVSRLISTGKHFQLKDQISFTDQFVISIEAGSVFGYLLKIVNMTISKLRREPKIVKMNNDKFY